MAIIPNGSAKKLLPYHITLILLKFKNLTVKDQVEASKLENSFVLCVSADLPFAHERFCGAESIDDVLSVSSFRSEAFGKDYGVKITSGPLSGLLSRAIVIIDESRKVIYTEQVPEIAQEPNYEAALTALP